jgi:hypothetical protein
MNGKFLAGFLVVDAVVDFRQYGVPVMAIQVQLAEARAQWRKATPEVCR